MGGPARDWVEMSGADEPAKFARQAELIRTAHQLTNQRHGKGRFLHRKPILGAAARLDVLPNLPPEASHGVFATPGSHEALVRLSNGSFDIQANTKPDIHGFALRILGVAGPGALGPATDHQDFLLINHDRFNAIDSDSFVEFATLAADNQAKALWTLLRRHGLGGLLARLKDLQQTMGKPFAGYGAETFNTVSPHAIGPYAARVLITPETTAAMQGKDPGADIAQKLAAGPIHYAVQLQFYTDPKATPIEDHRVVWSGPLLTVARLTLLAPADVETLQFDPWGGLADHRPLGEIMRARKAAYRASQLARS
ncbi:catalase [Devosia sp. FKR38]|uniref:catalase n=1 Tax=Devosia sp. FKR38 TaxID=2562312 RepID=UPI0010C03D8A|nr:catalase [Devosia sp. FKR38]